MNILISLLDAPTIRAVKYSYLITLVLIMIVLAKEFYEKNKEDDAKEKIREEK